MADDRFDQVVAAAAQGEGWAWTVLHRDLSPAVRGYVVGCGATDPDTVVGEAFVRLARDLAGTEADPDEVVVWVFLHARAVLGERRELALDAGRTGGGEAPPLVMMALANLRPIEREVLLLRVTAKLDDEAVATVIGRDPQDTRAILTSALTTLAEASG